MKEYSEGIEPVADQSERAEADSQINPKRKAVSAAIEEQRPKVDFRYCQVDRVLEAYEKGDKVEFETMGPYLMDYDIRTGKIWRDNLTAADRTGLELAKILRGRFPKARMVSLYDEYNGGMIDHSDIYGKPSDHHSPRMEYSEKAKKAFRNNLKELITDEVAGELHLVSESSKIPDAEILVEKLRQAGLIREDEEGLWFVNLKAESEDAREFLLRTAKGRWKCEALDSSSYLSPENREICHLIVLPESFRSQQNRVWEILKVLGIRPTNYHNIFFEEDAKTEDVVEKITSHFSQAA